jgi:hypothetical protein
MLGPFPGLPEAKIAAEVHQPESTEAPSAPPVCWGGGREAPSLRKEGSLFGSGLYGAPIPRLGIQLLAGTPDFYSSFPPLDPLISGLP